MSALAFTRSSSRAWLPWHLPKSGARKHEARVTRNPARFSVIASTDCSSKTLKADLLSLVAGLDRGFLASDEDVQAAELASKRLEENGDEVELPRDVDKLQGKWRLVYTSAFSSGNLGGNRPGPPVGRFPLTLGPVYQRIDVLSREFDNIVELRLPTPWPLPLLETRATLAHTFDLPGGARVKITFERTVVKTLGALGELPPLEIPRLPEFLRSSSSGEFDVTYLDDDFRITRGDRGELRVFIKL